MNPLNYATLEAEVKEKDEEAENIRQILLSGLDRKPDVSDSLRALAVIAINGLYWRDKQIAALQGYKDATLGQESERERQIVALTTERDDLDGRLTEMSKTAWEYDQKISDLTATSAKQAEAILSLAFETKMYLDGNSSRNRLETAIQTALKSEEGATAE